MVSEEMKKLEQRCAICGKCGLGATRTRLVFGVGKAPSELMFVGEGPGEQEDLQGEPFVGPAGKLLDDMLEMIGLERKRVYIANTVKCRPPMNRDPQEEEMAACRPWLEEQIRLVRPKIIVCLGRIAAGEMIKKDFRITREHGQWFEKDGVKMMAIYHPSALLRDVSKRPETFADLRELRRVLRRETSLYSEK